MKIKKLWNLTENESCTIQEFHSSIEPDHLLRLNELGFSLGALIRCIKETPFGGPRVYQVQDSYFSLDQEIASQITVN